MKLYGRTSSINVQKVLWCLAELGLVEGRDFERIDAGLQFGVAKTPEYLALNPNGLVPTLVDGEHVLWESNTILRYLASSRRADALLPGDPAMRAAVERWMDWQLGTLWATLRVAYLGLTRTPETGRNDGAIKASYHEATRLLAIADRVLQQHPYLALDRFTLADIGVAISARRWRGLAEKRTDLLGEQSAMLSLSRWVDTLVERPAYKSIMAAH